MSDTPGHLDIPQALAFVRGLADEQATAHVLACRACSGLVLGLDPTALEGLLPSTRLMVVPRHLYSDQREGPSGGMGRTYTAIDERLGRRVLIKEVIPLPDDDTDEAALQTRLAARLAREARITARLQHPNIISVYEAGRWSDDGTAFYAMEYAGEDAVTLAQALENATTSVKARLAFVPVVTSVAKAIAYAHAHGVVHRDLTPANILLAGGRTDSAVVIDWGVAVELGGDPPGDILGYAARDHEHALLTTGIGTPGFMAPEQARGDAPARTVDVFGLGALLYFVVTGRAPFHDNASERGKHAPLPQACPPELARIIEKALAHKPTDRYADAQALVDALVDYQSEQLLEAPRARRRVRRVAALLVPIAVLGGLGGYLFQLRGTLAEERRVADNANARADKTTELAYEANARAGKATELAYEANARANSSEALSSEYAVQLEQALKRIENDGVRDVRTTALVKRTRAALDRLTAELKTERTARKEAAESQLTAQRLATEAESARAEEQAARIAAEHLGNSKEAAAMQLAAELARERTEVAALRQELTAARSALVAAAGSAAGSGVASGSTAGGGSAGGSGTSGSGVVSAGSGSSSAGAGSAGSGSSSAGAGSAGSGSSSAGSGSGSAGSGSSSAGSGSAGSGSSSAGSGSAGSGSSSAGSGSAGSGSSSAGAGSGSNNADSAGSGSSNAGSAGSGVGSAGVR